MKTTIATILFCSVVAAQTVTNGGMSISGDVTLRGLTNKNSTTWVPVTAPAAKPTLALGGAGNVTGSFYYWVSFVTALGETEEPTGHDFANYDMSAAMVAGPITASSQQVNLTNIPVSTDPRVTGRNIYRSINGDGKTGVRLTS